ncbi:MAG: hypothetical protein MOGMAGMI_01193 [Candidatus Omnitrophica bacterium]|nr:hypothetical protein [Candidatus Omnitrophota bacterium]
MRRVLAWFGRRRVYGPVLTFTVLFYTGLAVWALMPRHTGGTGATATQTETAAPADEIKGVEDPDLDREQLKEREARFRERLEQDPRLATAIGGTAVLVLSLSLMVYAWILWRRLCGRPVLPRLHRPEAPRWRRRDVGEAFVMILFVEAALVTVQAILSIVIDLRALGSDFLLMANSLARNVLVAAYVILLVRRRYAQPVSDLGLAGPGAVRGVGVGLAAYVAALPLLFLTLLAMAALTQALSYEPEPQKVVQIYMKESAERHLPFFTLFVAVLGPMIEEVFFRGFAYPALKARHGAAAAMLGSSIIFAIVHLNLAAFVPIVLLGVFLAYLYERTGSLVPSMAAHATHNTIMVLFTLGFKNLSV